MTTFFFLTLKIKVLMDQAERESVLKKLNKWTRRLRKMVTGNMNKQGFEQKNLEISDEKLYFH